MMAGKYQLIPSPEEEQEEEQEQEDEGPAATEGPAHSSVGLADSNSSDIEDVCENALEAVHDVTGETQTLIPSNIMDDARALAKRKAQIGKVLVLSLVCLLEAVALPLHQGGLVFYSTHDEKSSILNAARYSFYGCFMCSCLFAPAIVAMFGLKCILVTGCLCVNLYICALFFPLHYSAIPVSVVAGFCLGPYFIAQGVFITNCAYRYCSTLIRCDPDVILCILNGIFYFIFLSAPIITNGLKLVLLQPVGIAKDELNRVAGNYTDNAAFCGRMFCPPLRRESLEVLTDFKDGSGLSSGHQLQALLGVFLTCGLAGLLACCLLLKSTHPVLGYLQTAKACCQKASEHEPLSAHAEISPREHCRSALTRWKEGVALLADTRILLLLPVFVFVGVQEATLYRLFTEDFVACRLGQRWTYWIGIVAAAVSIVVALPVGVLVRFTGRLLLILPISAIQFSLVLTLLLWQPGPDQSWGVFFAIAALWGCTDVTWQMLISSLLGLLFRQTKEAAFGHFRLCQMAGILLVDLMRVAACTTVNLYLILASLVLAVSTYVILEIKVKLSRETVTRPGHAHAQYMFAVDHATWLPGLDPHTYRQRAVLTSHVPKR